MTSGRGTTTGLRPGPPVQPSCSRTCTRWRIYHFEMLHARLRRLHDLLATSASHAFPDMPRPDDRPAWSAASTSSSSGPTTRCASSPGWPSSSASPTRCSATATPTRCSRAHRRRRGRRPWLAALEEAKDPWFWFSTGTGYCHQHRSWIDDLTVPFGAMQGYIAKLQAGESIDRPLDEILARARAHRRRVPRAAAHRRGPHGLRRDSSRWPARSTPTSRTTTSTSSTGTTRCSGTRSATSGASSQARRLPRSTSRTSSTCTATRCYEALCDLLTGWATDEPGPPPPTGRTRSPSASGSWRSCARGRRRRRWASRRTP